MERERGGMDGRGGGRCYALEGGVTFLSKMGSTQCGGSHAEGFSRFGQGFSRKEEGLFPLSFLPVRESLPVTQIHQLLHVTQLIAQELRLQQCCSRTRSTYHQLWSRGERVGQWFHVLGGDALSSSYPINEEELGAIAA
eukprot:Sspe_Gene.102264::Locus_77185_Transcript_2_2_Confidence_0.429_Length_1933::g.102264::m.102264